MEIISLGAGVQSTTLCLMAMHGFLPMPDCAIFADTGWEPAAVYEHLTWLESVLSFPIYRVSNGNIRNDYTNARFATMPFFLSDGGMLRRQCTSTYKLEPLRRKAKELGGGRLWIGISLDEIQRAKPSQVKYLTHWFPLVELDMRRDGCKEWLRKHGYSIPPRSACIGCPFRSRREWASLTENEYQDAIAYDELIRHLPRVNKDCYLHASRSPLALIARKDVSTDQGYQLNFWDNECEGMCGL